MYYSMLEGFRPPETAKRVAILIEPATRQRLNDLLYSPAFMGTGIGFSSFINRACEVAETQYAEKRTSGA